MRFATVGRGRGSQAKVSFAARPQALGSQLLGQLLAQAPALALGMVAAVIALDAGRIASKYLVAGAACLVFVIVLLAAPDSKRISRILLTVFAFSIPFNLQKTWFYRPHVGGAVGLTVALADVAACALAIVWLYRNATTQSRYLTRIHAPLVVTWLAFMAAGVLSLLHAPHPELVLFELIRLAKLLFLMIVVMNLEEEDVWIFLRWIGVGVLLESGLAMTQYTTKENLGLGLFGEEKLIGQELGATVFRASGTIGHPNMLGYYYEMLIPLMLALALAAGSGRARILYGAAAAFGFAGIIMTLSRGAWVGLPVSLSIVAVGMIHKRRLTWSMLRGAALVIMAGAVVLSIFLPTIHKRLTHTDYTSAQSRIPLNRATLSLVEQYPVFGVGLNNFQEVFKGYDRTGYSRRFAGYSHIVHNLYLFVLAEVGVVGFAAFIAFFAACLLTAVLSAPRAPPPRRAILIGVGSGLVAHLIHGLFDPGFKASFGVSTLVAVLVGLVGCVSLLERRDRSVRDDFRNESGRTAS